jgi:transglutaminase-like putative cysteine protease
MERDSLMTQQPSRWSMSWRLLTATAIVAILSAAASAGLHSITDDWSFLTAAIIGSLTAVGAFAVAHRWTLLPGETLAVAVGMFVVGGVIVVSVVASGDMPTPSAFGDFFDGLIRSWADLLSAVSPAELTPRLSVAPFAIAWIGTIVGCSLIRWSRVAPTPVLGPLVALAVTVLLTDEDRTPSLVVGATIAVGTLALGLLLDPRRRSVGFGGSTPDGDASGWAGADNSTETNTSVARHARTWRAGIVLAAVAIAAPLVGPQLPLADARERFDLRDQVVPPWDPLSVPSPLVQLKAALAAEREDDVVFEVASSTPLTRWSTAVLTSYDGVVWTVAEPDDAATDFRPVGPRLPSPPVQPSSDPNVTATVTIGTLAGPWVPVPGAARTLEFRNGPPPPIVASPASNTLAVPSGLASGTEYEVTVLQPPSPTDDALRDVELDVVDPTLDLEALPPQIRNLASDVTEGIDHGWGQIAAIRDLFRDEGFYDKTTRVPPGHSYYRLALFLSEPEQIVGFEEQYAAAAALIARIAELPVRVVVGYEIEPARYVDGVAAVRSSDASAWIEVRVDDIGWVPVSVSPPRSREPNTETSEASQDQVATPNPPPPPQVPPDVDVFSENEELEEPVEDEEEEEDDEKDDAGGNGGLGTLGWTLIGGGGLIALLLAAGGGIVAWKARRTRRRRLAPDPAARIAGAWLELTDRYEEAGVVTPVMATPHEAVREMARTETSASAMNDQLVGLARHVDRAAYDRVAPPPEDADSAWSYADEAVDALLAGRSLPRRTRMRVDPRPLLRRDPPLVFGRGEAPGSVLQGEQGEPGEQGEHATVDRSTGEMATGQAGEAVR